MAVLTTHLLNGVDGTHAQGVSVRLILSDNPSVPPVFVSETDAGGRLRQEVDSNVIDPAATYDLVIDTDAFWQRRVGDRMGEHIRQIVLCVAMPDPEGHYHMPVIFGPNTYSTWFSS